MSKKHFWGLEASDPPILFRKIPFKKSFFCAAFLKHPLILWSQGCEAIRLTRKANYSGTLDFFVGSSQT